MMMKKGEKGVCDMKLVQYVEIRPPQKILNDMRNWKYGAAVKWEKDGIIVYAANEPGGLELQGGPDGKLFLRVPVPKGIAYKKKSFQVEAERLN